MYSIKEAEWRNAVNLKEAGTLPLEHLTYGWRDVAIGFDAKESVLNFGLFAQNQDYSIDPIKGVIDSSI